MEYGTLYLIPSSLAGVPFTDIYSDKVLDILRGIDVFVVETPKIGRSFLRGLNKDKQISQLTFIELNENTTSGISEAIKYLKEGKSVGVISDAGYPGIGDMGANLVREAQKNEINVKTFAGPSSLLQTLASSGLNGQSFKFNGYAPKTPEERGKYIKELEVESIKTGQAQILIETPYRAQYLYEDAIKYLNKNSLLCLGVDIDMSNEVVKTKTISEWQLTKIELNKKQVVYIIQGRA